MGLREDILNEPVTVLDLRELIAVPPQTTVRQASAIMREKRLGCVVAVDEAGKPVGKFTERQLVRMLAKDGSRLDMPLCDVMTPDAHCIREDQTIAELMHLMQSKELRFVCVINAEGKAVALAGQKGLMEYICEHFPRQVKSQRMASKLYLDEREGA